MTALLRELSFYFQVVGMVSIGAWMVGLALVAWSACRRGRTLSCWLGLLVALLGYGLALYNSHNINDIRIDFSQELVAARERGRRMQEVTEENQRQQQKEKEKEEEDKKQKEAGTKEQQESEGQQGDKQPEVEEAYSEAAQKGAGTYSYRQRGKDRRIAGKKRSEKKKEVLTSQVLAKKVRTLRQEQVSRANHLDRINLFFARLTLGLAVLMVVVDYLNRFNKTFRSPFPLPLAGCWMDMISPKTHAVCVNPQKDGVWAKYLCRVVRKGETFIYFGPADPWPKEVLPRLPLAKGPLPSLKKITCTSGEERFDAEFVLESAWFGRYCFVVTDERLSGKWLGELFSFLQTRQAARASARRTVNVVWDLAAPIPEDLLRELVPLCKQTNFKLLVSTAKPDAEKLAPLFEEVHCEPARA